MSTDLHASLCDKIFRLEDHIRSIPGNGIEESGIKFVHHFADGIYAREMIVPEDVWITGMAHKTEHLSIFLEGKMIVATPEGSEEIKAPIVEIGRRGVKRAGYTIEPVRWITVHATHETDINVLESVLVTNDPEDIRYLLDQNDYDAFAIEYGMTDEVIDALGSIDVKILKSDNLELRPSSRHGTGVFSTGKIKQGDVVAHAIKDGELTQWSRYMNHSITPNARMAARSEGNIDIIAVRDIDGEEITVNYRAHTWAVLPIEDEL